MTTAPNPRVRFSFALLLSLAMAGSAAPVEAQRPLHVYLTWRGNTSTTMTVNAQTVRTVPTAEVRFDTVPHRGAPAKYASVVRGDAHQIEGVADQRWVHWIDLTALEPGRRYWFVVGSDAHGFSEERSFRTLPADDSPIRFAAGGDLGIGPVVRDLNAHAAARRPQFAIIGGDLAYANGVLADVAKWDAWFAQWEDVMITPEGLTVPMVVAAGNHEVRGGYLGGAEKAPFYVGFFAQSGKPSFFRTTFGSLMALYTLDTGHLVSHASQAAWLETAMSRDTSVPHRFAQYHVPMYPSHRDYDGASMRAAREHWLPLFDRYRLTAAFENHDHTFKRTHPLRGDTIAAVGGTVYFGDGAWGRGDRPVRLSSRWYLAAQGANRHVWIVDVRKGGVEYRAVDARGGVFHVYPSTLADAAPADAYFRTLPQQWELRENALSVSVKNRELEVALTNREDYPFIATLGAVTMDEQPFGRVIGDETAELQPGGTITRRIAIGDGVIDQPLQVRADLDVGAPMGRVYARVAHTVGFDVPLDATRVPMSDVVLDGAVNEWTQWPWEIRAPAPREDGAPSGWTGPSDASAKIAVRRLGDDLLVAVRIIDDARVISAGGAWDAGDGLLLWLDRDPDGDFNNDPYFGIARPETAGTARVILTDRDLGALVAGTRAWASQTTDGWSTEIRIPLALIGADGASGIPDSLRLNVGIVDVDRPGQNADVLLRRPEWELEWDYKTAGLVRVR